MKEVEAVESVTCGYCDRGFRRVDGIHIGSQRLRMISNAPEVVDATDRSDDEFFYGPDVGQAVRRGGFLYTKYGEVLPGSSPVRMMSCTADGVDENYADWSEEYRSAVREAYAAQDRKREAEDAAQRAHRDALVEQARVKLTTEEFDAVYSKGADDERGY